MGHPRLARMPEVFGFISPHLDDAVFSCSGFLARHPGCHVVTVFAQGPARVEPLPRWDERAGFRPGSDVAAIRREEDGRAAALLGFQTHYLRWWEYNYRDARYGYRGPGDEDQLVGELAEDLVGAMSAIDVDRWVVPLGIENKDHELVALASAQALRRLGPGRWLIYEEVPNYTTDAELRRQWTAHWEAYGNAAFLELGPDDSKFSRQEAMECYQSQLTALGPEWLNRALRAPESFLELAVP